MSELIPCAEIVTGCALKNTCNMRTQEKPVGCASIESSGQWQDSITGR